VPGTEHNVHVAAVVVEEDVDSCHFDDHDGAPHYQDEECGVRCCCRHLPSKEWRHLKTMRWHRKQVWAHEDGTDAVAAAAAKGNGGGW